MTSKRKTTKTKPRRKPATKPATRKAERVKWARLASAINAVTCAGRVEAERRSNFPNPWLEINAVKR